MEIPSARSWAAPVRATGTVRKRQAVRLVYHVQNHTCGGTLLQTARRAAVLDQPSSLRPHWSQMTDNLVLLFFFVRMCMTDNLGADVLFCTYVVMTDNLGLMFCCVRMKVLTQGLPHFLQENISERRVIRVPPKNCLKKDVLHPEKNKEDKRIFSAPDFDH
jgi:hypothetical protein